MILRRCNSPAVARSCLCTGYSVFRPKLTVKTASIFIPKHGMQTIYSLYKTLKIYPYKLNSFLNSHFPFQMNNNNNKNNNNNNLYSAIQLPFHSAWQCENNSPIVFLTPWKQWSAVCILYCSPIYTLRIIWTWTYSFFFLFLITSSG